MPQTSRALTPVDLARRRVTALVPQPMAALTLFLDRPEVPLHNNDSEAALRKPVRGRKNFHGTKNRDGARVASMAYMLCETARKNGLRPSAYLREVSLRSLANPGAATLPADLVD